MLNCIYFIKRFIKRKEKKGERQIMDLQILFFLPSHIE